MKKRFIKGLSVATAVCLSMTAPVSSLAKEVTSENEGYVNGVSNTSNDSVTDSDDLDYAVSNHKEGTVKENNSAIETEEGGIYATHNSTVNQTGDVKAKDEGVRANENSTVNVTGNINVEKRSSDLNSTAIEASEGSSVTVNGNVNSEGNGIHNEGSSVTVHGSVNVEGTNADGIVGVISTDASTAIDNDLTVHNSNPEHAYSCGINADSVIADNSEISVKGDIKVSSDNTKEADAEGIDVVNRKDKHLQYEKSSTKNSFTGNVIVSAEGKDWAYATGLYVASESKENYDVVLNGDINASAKSANESKTDDASATGVSVTAYNGGTTSVTLNGDITAEAESSNKDYSSASGISVHYIDDKSTVNITVKGDVSGSNEGASVSANDGEVNIIVDGTLSGADSAIYVQEIVNGQRRSNHRDYSMTGENGNLNITVWQLKSDSDQLVYAQRREYRDSDGNGTNSRTEQKDKEEVILKNINYIIRTDEVSNGTIILSGTTLMNGYNTAHESQEVIIKVETSSGYKLDAVKNGSSTLTKNADGTYTLVVPRGGGVELSAVLSAIRNTSDSSSDSSDSGSGSGANGLSGNAGSINQSENTMTSESGASVNTTISESNGVKSSTAQITIGDKTANVATSVTSANGQNTTLRFVSGDIAGATFNGVGTVSADGATVTTISGETFAVTSAPVLVITSENGQSMGCFVDPQTGAPVATGKTEVYYQLGEDGQLHAHWVNPQGFFYTGTVEINGQMFTFNEEGIMVTA
ncbi:hypothetical protein [Oribacterium sp. P6A1]|uniref:hypothetical protein n=1 Tax=Oribacterium sp. P6A1 TaxID=1410612 RepID=UPI00055F8376|nr:hypothetical protein [Oribacterium sp. P6A1]